MFSHWAWTVKKVTSLKSKPYSESKLINNILDIKKADYHEWKKLSIYLSYI